MSFLPAIDFLTGEALGVDAATPLKRHPEGGALSGFLPDRHAAFDQRIRRSRRRGVADLAWDRPGTPYVGQWGE